MKKTYSSVLLLLTMTLTAQANHFQLSVDGGFLFSSLSNNETVDVATTVTNLYETDEKTKLGYLGGGTLAYVFEQVAASDIDIGIGLSFYYMNYGVISGIEYPMINGGVFDTLDYSFKAQSMAAMLEPKFIYAKYNIQPYAILGFGPSWNRLYDYDEVPSDPNGGAAPASNLFRSNTNVDFAYELGLGLQYVLPEHPHDLFKYLVSADYRYMHMGKGELGTMLTQDTDDHIEVSPLNTQTLILAITMIF